jgi:hypothetical protein
VWSANLGWIALATLSSDLATTSLTRTDSDEDGISDEWEMKHFSGSLAVATASSDADGDSASDLMEYLAGTHPKDPTSYFRIVNHSINFSAGTANIEFTSRPNRLYRIDSVTDLAGVWTVATSGWFTPSSGATTSRGIPLPGGSAGFFRAVVRQPLEP